MTINLQELHYTKADLMKAPEKEAIFFILATNLANDLSVVTKIYLTATKVRSDDVVVEQGASAVGMLALRLTAGRLSEGWKSILHEFRAIRADYEPDLPSDGKQALANLEGYFSTPGQGPLIKRVRDKIAFHADSGIIKRALSRIDDDVEMGDYINEQMGNTLYYSSEIVHYQALWDLSGTKTQREAIETLIDDYTLISNYIMTFVHNFALVFFKRHLPDALSRLGDETTEISDAPKLDELLLTYFVER